ncbi:hypothetical protein J2T60_000526 [Natronospira proteinivora]|uniref:Apea-like HEPN domain-containing protein n=1 Tax=Natronospira proteinivora TaxID=1807133 RepID=A0ABT1G5I2_9GAMM|nr:hypothetical protein [Natronospira proteinivora]MCP1726561.1 hypothetical protein [Natronospira proteinivora]
MSKAHKPKAPDWALSPLEEFLNRSEHLATVVRLSVQGMSMAKALPKAMEALRRADGENLDAELHEKAVRDAEFVEKERSEGFPVVHGQAVLSLWSLLELAVKDLVAAWIKNNPDLLLAPPISSLKMKIGDYLMIEEDERCLFFVDVIERDVGAGIKNGINRFESLTSTVGLSGVTPRKMNEIFFEFGQVRNALAHQGNRADKKLITNCPWLDLEAGKDLRISSEMFQKYHKVSLTYATLLICRTAERFGVDMQSEREGLFDAYA